MECYELRKTGSETGFPFCDFLQNVVPLKNEAIHLQKSNVLRGDDGIDAPGALDNLVIVREYVGPKQKREVK